MKIAVSVLSDISRAEGVKVRAKRVFELLHKNYDCTLIIRGERDSISENVVVIRPSKLWNLQLVSVFLKDRFDLVFCESDFWGFFSYFMLARVWGCKVVLEAHGIFSVENESRLLNPNPVDKIRIQMDKWRERFVIKHADCVIALSSDICTYYRKFNKCIFLIPTFVDEKKFKSRKSANEEESDNGEEKIVGLIGPFAQHHYVDLNSLDFLYRNIIEFDERIKFVVIGECDYRIRNERVSYTGYLSDSKDYANELTLLDAVLVASRFPTSGPLNKILEPMACSLPVFATPTSAVGLDHIRPGTDIFVCDERELVAKVNESLFNADLMEKVGKNARGTVETYYSADVNYRKLVEVINRLSTPS